MTLCLKIQQPTLYKDVRGIRHKIKQNHTSSQRIFIELKKVPKV